MISCGHGLLSFAEEELLGRGSGVSEKPVYKHAQSPVTRTDMRWDGGRLSVRQEGENGFKVNEGSWGVGGFQKETVKGGQGRFSWRPSRAAELAFNAGVRTKDCCAPWWHTGSWRPHATAETGRPDPETSWKSRRVRCLFFCLLRELKLK